MADFRARIDKREVDKMLKRVGSRARNANPFMKTAFGVFGFADIMEHFRREQGPGGRKWTPLAPSTVRSRRSRKRKGRGRIAILQDTGNMRQNTTPGTVRDAGRNEIIVFNNAPYSAKHDEGLDGLPQRQFMYFTDRALDNMARFILGKITGP